MCAYFECFGQTDNRTLVCRSTYPKTSRRRRIRVKKSYKIKSSISISPLCIVLYYHQSAVVRLVGAIIKTLKDLVQAGTTTSTSTSTTPSLSASSLPTGSTSIPVGGASKDVLQVTLPDSVTRIILILWQCPVNANTTLSEESFFRLMRLFLRLPSSQSAKVLSALESYPSHLFASRLLKPLQEHLSLQMLTGNNATLYHHFLSSFSSFLFIFIVNENC